LCTERVDDATFGDVAGVALPDAVSLGDSLPSSAATAMSLNVGYWHKAVISSLLSVAPLHCLWIRKTASLSDRQLDIA